MKMKLLVGGFVFFLLTMLVSAYSEYGSPTEFGNLTDTTCYVGGDPGIVNCTGAAYFNSLNINGSQLTELLTGLNQSIYSWEQDVNANTYSLTDLGELIMSGLITSYDIIPYTTELYSLGNSTNWFEEAYIRNLYSENINTTEMNSTNVNSDNVDVDENLTLKNITIKEESEDLIIILTDN